MPKEYEQRAKKLDVDVPGAMKVANPYAETLDYPGLAGALEKARQHRAAAERVVFSDDQNPNSGITRELLLYYQLETMARMLGATATKAQGWADRYTQATIELYGSIPDPHLVGELAATELARLPAESRIEGRYRQLVDVAGHEAPAAEHLSIEKLQDTTWLLGTYLRETTPVVAQTLPATGERFSYEQFATWIERIILPGLVQYEHPNWQNWGVDRPSTAQLSTNVNKQLFKVGINQPDDAIGEARGFALHELEHARRSVMALDEALAKGLPGYNEFEEGLGGLIEMAMTGRIPERIQYRYIDTALALGQHGSTPVNRHELVLLDTERRGHHLTLAGFAFSPEELKARTYEHVNRIYKGTPGNEVIGIHTKDATYYTGLLKSAEYIRDCLSRGHDMHTIMSYLRLGKFDPTNPEHVNYLRQRGVPPLF